MTQTAPAELYVRTTSGEPPQAPPSLRYDADKGDGRTSDSAASLSLLNSILGSGLLGLPFVFRSCGCALGLLLLAVCTLAAVQSTRLLLHCAHATGCRSYSQLATRALGEGGGALASISSAGLQLGSLVCCVNVLADLLSAWAGSGLPPGAEPSRHAVLLGTVVLALLPTALAVRSPRSASALTAAGVTFSLAFVAALAAHAAAPRLRPPLALWRPGGTAVALPVVSYALGSGHASLLAMATSLRAPSPAHASSVAARALACAALVYAAVGLGGYASFGERTSGDVLRNFGGAVQTPAVQLLWQTLRLGYGVSIVAAVPLTLLPLREALTPLAASAAVRMARSRPMRASRPQRDWPGERGHQGAGRHSELPPSPVTAARAWALQGCITAVLLAAVLLCALMVPNLEFVLALVGSTAVVLLSYVLPAAIHLRVGGGGWFSALSARLLLLCGLLFFCVCTAATLSAVAEEAGTVQLAQALVAAERTTSARTHRIQSAVADLTSLEAVEDAAAGLSLARHEAADALGRMQSAAAALEQTQARPGWLAAHQAHAASDADAAELEGAAAALAAARSKVDARLAGVLSAAEALDELPSAPPQPTLARAEARGAPPRDGAVRARANATASAVQQTTAALDAVQRAANQAAGARGGSRASGASAGLYRSQLDAAAAAVVAADASLSELQAAAGSQALQAELALVDALREAAEEGELEGRASGQVAVSRAAAPPPMNSTQAARAAVQAVALTALSAQKHASMDARPELVQRAGEIAHTLGAGSALDAVVGAANAQQQLQQRATPPPPAVARRMGAGSSLAGTAEGVSASAA